MTSVIRQRSIFLISIALLLLSLFNMETTRQSILEGVETALRFVLPSLFPALVLSRLIADFAPRRLGKFLPVVMGLLCGFPIGAITVCRLYEKGALSHKTAQALLAVSNVTGPAFLIGSIGTGVFQNSAKGAILFALQAALSLISAALILRKEPSSPPPPVSPESLSSAIVKAGESFLGIFSCILFFSFFVSLLFRLLPPLPPALYAFFYSVFEISGACAALRSVPSESAFSLAAFAVGWAGFSVHLQTSFFIQKARLSFPRYLLAKAFFALGMYLVSKSF